MSDDGPAPPSVPSRRTLLGAAGAFVALPALRSLGEGGSDVLPSAGPAEAQTGRPPAREPLETLSDVEMATLEAIAARLIPTDSNGPGAAEARAAHYIDRALGGALSDFRDTYRSGLATTDAYARTSKGAAFAQLAPAEQDAVLSDMERNAAFDGSAGLFGVLLSHTLQGTFGDPFYGGNRNFAGWDLIGYPGVRLAVTAEQQNLDAKPAATRMSAYDYTMFVGRKPARGH